MMPNRFRFLRLGAAFLMAGLTALLRAEDYSITTFAGQGNVVTGVDGTPGSFNNPYGVAVDAQKNVYVTDTLNNTIRKISPAGAVTTLAGTVGSSGSTNGTSSAARFNFPVGIAVDGSGNVYVADSGNRIIRKITPAGVVTTYAGAAAQIGTADGPAASARFFLPYGIAVDNGGAVYVADAGNHNIRKIAVDGTVTTLAGAAQASGFADGSGAAARFNIPWGLSVDASNNIYVADSGNNVIRRITPAGAVTTVAGSSTGQPGSQDGAAASARFDGPRGVAVDGAGNVYVADSGKSILRHITPGGVVSTLAGTSGIVGESNSVGASARFYDPYGIAADGTTVYIADTSNNVIRRGVPASQASVPDILASPLEQEVAVGQSVTLTVVATGTNLAYRWLKNNVEIAGATGASYTIASAQLSDVGAYKARVSSGANGPAKDSEQANLSVVPVGTGAIAITARPLNQSVAVNANVTFSITAAGAGLTYQWLFNGTPLTGATSATYNIPSAQTANAGTYSVRLTSGSSVETISAKLTVGGSGGTPGTPIEITTQPSNRIVDAGSTTTFSVAATGDNLTYQWFKDGAPIAGATSATLTITNVAVANVGSYYVRVTSGPTSRDSVAATLAIVGEPGPGPGGPTARLSNLSVRTTLAANQILIVGATVSGGSSNILVRAAGPALAAFGLPTAMADPKLQLFNGQTLAFENNDWDQGLATTFASVGAFAFPPNSKDAAFVRSIEGGPTIQASGPTGGVLLVEAYDLSTSGNARLVNVSARNFVGTDDNILIAGVVIAGSGNKRLLVRAVGAKLAAFGVSGAIVDPKLEIYGGADGKTKLNENDNWDASLATTFTSVGAFPLDVGSRDAAVVVSLAPGAYTIQMSGVGGGTGEGLIEVYELP